MIGAKKVASYFISKANALGDGNKELSGNNDLTNLKLQKLLYFTQVEYLKKHGEKLFDEEIQAWQYGPVVKEVYDWLKGCGAYVITEFDIALEDLSDIPDDIKAFLDEMWNKYQKYSAWGLVEKTHEKNSAWDKVYAGGNGDKKVIDVNLLKEAAIL